VEELTIEYRLNGNNCAFLFTRPSAHQAASTASFKPTALAIEDGAIGQRASIVEDSRGGHCAEMMRFPALVSEKFVAPPGVKFPRSSRPR
jgi:hypothetical protein